MENNQNPQEPQNGNPQGPQNREPQNRGPQGPQNGQYGNSPGGQFGNQGPQDPQGGYNGWFGGQDPKDFFHRNNPNQSNRPNPENDKKKNNKRTIIGMIVAAVLIFLVMGIIESIYESATTKEITYNEFVEMLEDGKVEKVEFSSSGMIKITPETDQNTVVAITYTTAQLNDEELIQDLKDGKYGDVTYVGKIESTRNSILVSLIPFIIIYGFFFWIFRKMTKSGGGVMGVGKSNAKVYVEKETGVTFKDVAGQDEAKESVKELVDFLHYPEKYAKVGAKLPKGALLVGPPGTGKTLLAKAVAGEAKVPFFSLSGSDFVEMFVGVGASRVRDLFKQAQKEAPCIVFIDEIDAIGKSRDSAMGNDEREQTLNQLLSEMDGFDSSKGVLILAATNRPEVLDPALLRPGRFDRRVIVDKPDYRGRLDVLKVHSRGVRMDESVDLEAIAMATSGAVGSDLANMINEAAILAVQKGRQAISQADLFESVEVVIAGKEKKDRILSKEEKKIVSYHEVGHALVTALQKDAEPVQKITIVPRTMGSLGYVMTVPEEEKYLMTKKELHARLVTLLGGRASEELNFDSITTGASNDLEKATDLARAMVTRYGMSDALGLACVENVEHEYLGGKARLNCSETTAAEIDAEVRRVLNECYEEAKKMLSDNGAILDKIAEFLYKRETITGAEFMDIFHRVQAGEEILMDEAGQFIEKPVVTEE